MDLISSLPQLDRNHSLLAALPLFHSLTTPQIQLAQSVMHRKVLPAGQILMTESQAGGMVYAVVEGAVRICVRRGERDVIIGLRGPGDLLGEMSVLDGDGRSATVITQTNCVFFWVSSSDFWEVLWPMPPVSRNVTALLARRIRTLTGQIEAMATLPVQGRLARQVLSLARDYGRPVHLESAPHAVEIPFRLTQADLANMIGATRVQVNQVFCAWKRRNVVRIDNSHLHVLDEATLKALTM